jgi:hypothetical protein
LDCYFTCFQTILNLVVIVTAELEVNIEDQLSELSADIALQLQFSSEELYKFWLP